MWKNEIDHTVDMSLAIGAAMLKFGAETSRVEETIVRFAHALGVESAHSFATPTGIFLSIMYEGQEQTRMYRIEKGLTVDLDKVSQLNDLSRQLEWGRINKNEAEQRIRYIVASPSRYPNWLLQLSAAISGGGYAAMFGGMLSDFATALVGALVSSWVYEQISKKMPRFLAVFFGALVGIVAAKFMMRMGIGRQTDLILLGTIIPLVPGLAITNSARDLMAGDLLSGVARAAEALLTAGALAVAVVLTLSLE